MVTMLIDIHVSVNAQGKSRRRSQTAATSDAVIDALLRSLYQVLDFAQGADGKLHECGGQREFTVLLRLMPL
jgi:hypothetical protein